MADIQINRLKEQLQKYALQMNQKNPYLLLGIILFVILSVAYLGAMRFQISYLRSVNPEIMRLSQEFNSTQSHIARVPQYRQEVQRLTVELQSVNEKIRSKEQIPAILENISRMANEHGVEIEKIMPNTAASRLVLQNNNGQYYSIPILVEALSGYHNLGRFINRLEREEDFFSIPEFTITTNAEDPTNHVVKLTIDAVVFEKNP